MGCSLRAKTDDSPVVLKVGVSFGGWWLSQRAPPCLSGVSSGLSLSGFLILLGVLVCGGGGGGGGAWGLRPSPFFVL